jgi:uncharacterized protein (TIGR02246 family)
MIMQRFLGAVSAGILLFTTVSGFAADTKTAGPRPIPELRALLTAMEESFSRGDAKELAACWTPSGDFTGPAGERVEGRPNIEKAFRDFLAVRKNSKLKLQVVSLRLANDGLALVDTIPEVQPASRSTDMAGLSLVLVKREGRWLIESARETLTYAPSQAQPMNELAWMVGDWSDDVSSRSGVSMHSTCDWTANRTFLIRKFEVEGKSGASRAGTEVIGWDPRARRIRSWVFESNGGFGESAWVRDGNRWLIRYSGTQADGSEVSATNILTMVDANTLTLQSKDRTADGQQQPEVPKITIKRQAASKDTAKPKEPSKPPQRVLP